MRASWTGTVLVQRLTKSYPDVARDLRVQAAHPDTAARLVVRGAFEQLAPKLRHRRIQSVTVTLQKLGHDA